MSDDRECSDLLAILQETLDSQHANICVSLFAIKNLHQRHLTQQRKNALDYLLHYSSDLTYFLKNWIALRHGE